MDVVDVNDETPYFPFSEYTATMMEDTQRGQSVASVKAIDDDSSSQVCTCCLGSHCGIKHWYCHYKGVKPLSIVLAADLVGVLRTPCITSLHTYHFSGSALPAVIILLCTQCVQVNLGILFTTIMGNAKGFYFIFLSKG